jgi:hypothetical protein
LTNSQTEAGPTAFGNATQLMAQPLADPLALKAGIASPSDLIRCAETSSTPSASVENSTRHTEVAVQSATRRTPRSRAALSANRRKNRSRPGPISRGDQLVKRAHNACETAGAFVEDQYLVSDLGN